ncbi:MAG: YceH family protein [Pirellulales bacterium]
MSGTLDRSPGADDASSAPKWQPLSPRQRRVAGVLIEKAKTVPDSYPMTINSLISGCNQKSNRDPHMDLSEEDIEQVLEELRAMGAVVEIQGGGRVPKYKHNLYEWFGVDKVEIAVLAELLLRGPQTLGELRTRAARMEPIPDQGTLQNLLRLLQSKKLLLELTPPGRGQIVTHNIYKDRELPELKARYAGHRPGAADDEDEDDRPRGAMPSASTPSPASFAAPTPAARVSQPATTPSVTLDMFAELRVEVAELRAEVSRLRDEFRKLLE